MLKTSGSFRARMAALLLGTGFISFCSSADALVLHPNVALQTSDIRVRLRAGATAPMLTSIEGPNASLWQNQKEDALPASVELNGTRVALTWLLKPESSEADEHHVTFAYESSSPHLRLLWTWEARAAFGPLEHRVVLENLSGKKLWLPMVDSLRLEMRCLAKRKLLHFYVEKGADTPSAQGTHLASMSGGYSWIGTSSTYASPALSDAREIIPAELVFSADQPQAGWYAGIEFSGRTRISLQRNARSVATVLGLNPDPGLFRTQLEPGSKFETPSVFLGAFSGGPDGAGNQLRPWVRAVLGNPLTWKDPQYPLTVNNSWGSGMQVDEALAMRMIEESKELGFEMFHLDAGWFRGVGDWYPDAKKFPHGLAFVADAAHRQGLRFGMWADWTQAGVDTEPGALNVRDRKVRDWLVSDLGPSWKPEEFKGETTDLGVPAVHDYAAKEVKRIVEDFHLDMLEHDGYLVAQGCVRDDHPHAAPNQSTMRIIHDSGFDFALGSNSTDVSYHAVRAYYDIYENLRREHPGLLFEICNDGGRMVDFGSAAHGDYFSITDTYDPLSNRRAFYDASYLLPAAMLESYVEKWPVPRRENLLYMLRSGMMGWLTIMLDTTAWTPEQHQAAREAIALYKQKLRPLIRDARLYHVSARPDGVNWDGIEYWNPARSEGVVFAFRGTTPTETEHSFVLAGLDPARSYQFHFEDGSAPVAQATGGELMTHGLKISLPNPLSSELVFISEVSSKH